MSHSSSRKVRHAPDLVSGCMRRRQGRKAKQQPRPSYQPSHHLRHRSLRQSWWKYWGRCVEDLLKCRIYLRTSETTMSQLHFWFWICTSRPYGSMQTSSCLLSRLTEHVIITMTVFWQPLTCWDLMGLCLVLHYFTLPQADQSISLTVKHCQDPDLAAVLEGGYVRKRPDHHGKAPGHWNVRRSVHFGWKMLNMLAKRVAFSHVLGLFYLRIFKSWTMFLQSNQIPFVQREAQISSQKTKNVASTKIAPIWGTLPEEIGESKWWNWVRMAILLGWQRWQAECWLVVCWCYWQWEGFILSLPVVKTIRQTKHYGIMKHKK